MNERRKSDIELPPETIIELVEIFSRYPEVEKVEIFGSRVLGNAKVGSDVDCALSGSKLTPLIVNRIQNYLENETLIPYFFDCIHLESLKNEALRLHIKKYGKVLCQKKHQGCTSAQVVNTGG